MDEDQKLWRGMRPGGLSVLSGLCISLLFTILLLVAPAGCFRALCPDVIWPVEAVLGLAVPNAIAELLCPKIRMVSQILGWFVTWGIFFSAMIYGCLCKGHPVTQVTTHALPRPNAQRSPGLALPIVAMAILVLGVIISAADNILNTYRAFGPYSRCGQDFAGTFELVATIEAIAEGVSVGIPIILIAVFYWRSRAGKAGDIVTVLTGIIYAGASCWVLVQDTLAQYAPCDLKGDQSALGLFFFGMLMLFLWILCHGVTTLIEERRRAV